MRHRFMGFFRLAFMALAVIALLLPVVASDWPTYMHDNSRSGVTTDTLTLTGLNQQWLYTPLAAPALAWPVPQSAGNEFPKSKFDDAFYTVGVGDLVYFGSSVDNKIYALNAVNGNVVWSYYTGGAVRTAPTVSGGYLYACSDDGYVYCLNASTGAFVWKYSTMTTPKWMLGNDRMVNECPSRTGVLVNGSNVYFGYGNFRNKGIGLTARNATSGTQVWLNSTAGTNSDFSPQGYPVMTSTRIIAPSGRMRPSAFLISDGTYSYTAVAPDPDQHPIKGTAGGSSILLSPDGATFYLGTQNILRAYNATDGTRLASADWDSAKQLIITSTRYYKLAGKDTPDDTAQSRVVAYDSAKTQLWSYPASGELNLCSIILTGNYVIAGASGTVYALDVADGSMDWSRTVDGRAVGLMVANNQLYVSTDTGKVYCFGNGTPVTPTTPSFVEPFPGDDAFETAAAAVVTQAGMGASSKGYCLVTGTGTAPAKMGYNIAKRTNLRVHCAVINAADVLSTRQALEGSLLYGTRIVVDEVPSTTMPYPDYFANLVVHVSESGQTNPLGSELLRVTRPCGGWLMYGPVSGYTAPAPSSGDQTLWDAEGTLTVTASDGFLSGAGPWYLLNRDPLSGTGSWTHQNANAANTGSSEDQRVRPTLAALWYGKPGADETPDRHLRTVAPLSHNGKVFHQGYNLATGREYIVCYDAYNGTRYWETDIAGAYRVETASNSGNLACNDTYLFVVTGTQCKRVDIDTGTISATYSLPSGCTGNWGYIAVDGTTIIGSSTTIADPYVSDTLFARDIATGMSGSPLWTYQNGTFRNNVVAISNGRVFLDEQRAGQTGNNRYVVALNRTTGALIWEKQVNLVNTGGMLLAKNGVLAFGVVCNPYGGASDPNRRVIALAMDDGRLLWDKAVGNKSRPIAVGYRLIAQPSAYHLIDGTQTTFNMSRMSACGAISASASMLFFREAITMFANAFTAGKSSFYNMRPGCWINIVPAAGVVVQPEASSGCACYYSIQCAMAYKTSAAGPPTAPTVSITAPNGGASIHGVINITATASDNSAVTAVEFYADGNPIGVDSSSPYSISWTWASNASHAITAIAYDDEGAKTTSSTVNVTETNTPPSTALTAPDDGANVTAPANISITATASDTDGTISKVEFYQGTTLLGTDSSSPYSYDWNSVAAGAYLLTSLAYDDDSMTKLSASRLIIVKSTNSLPTVSITSPTAGTDFIVPATIAITANAADSDGSIVKVEFYADAGEGAGPVYLGEDDASPYSYSWEDVDAGDYTLTAKAIDNNYEETTSAGVLVHALVAGNSRPTVSLTSPANGAVIIGNSLTITANASDSDGTVTRVAFYRGTEKLGEDSTSPYSFDWTNITGGKYTLTAKAYDDDLATTISSPASINVWNTADIGTVGVTGNAGYSNGIFTVTGAGANGLYTYTTDAFRFVYQQHSGDCVLIARVRSFESTSANTARVGVIIRESLNADSKYAGSLMRTYNNRAHFPKRTTTGAAGVDAYNTVTAPSAPYWVKVVRWGNYLTGHRAPDVSGAPGTWTQTSNATITMTNPLYVGLAVTSGSTTAAKTATLEYVTISNGNAAPSVSITSPSYGANFNAPTDITITASASDTDGSVTKVEFYQGAVLLNTDSTSPYSYTWSNVGLGDYTLTAKATDDNQGVTTSTPVLIHVINGNLPPTVSITSPSNGAVFAPSANVTINADASDSDGTVTKVDFYQGTTLLGTDSTSPYSYTWNSVASGSYALTTKATDDDTDETVSSAVNIRVNTLPTVSVTYPADEAIFTAPATFTITANASDSDGTISKVEFYQGTTKLGEDNASPYSYDWSNVSIGDYVITAKSTDSDSGVTTSAAIDVHVTSGANIPPSVTLTAPTNGTVIVGDSYTLTATASDTDGTITKVEFYQGTTKIGEDSTSPYSYNWTSITGAVYAITAKAIDDDLASTDSSAASLSVWNTSDIGTVGVTGSASYSNGTFTVAGAGANGIYTYTADAFRYVYQQMSGDCTIIARAATFDYTTNNTARVGVVIRQSLAAGSTHVASMMRTHNRDRAHFARRTTADAAGADTYATVTAPSLPYWIKVVRSGNTLSAHRAPDNSGTPGTWTQTGSVNITMTNPVYVGLVVCSGDTVATKTATFTNVSVTSP